MASTLKSLDANGYTRVPFKAYAQQTFTIVSGSASNPTEVAILYGEQYSDTALRTPNSTYELYDSVNHVFYSTESVALSGIDTSKYVPSQSLYAVSLSNSTYGDEVKRESFTLELGGSSIFDDGDGHLITSQSSVGYYVGNIFYDKGVAIIKAATTPTGSISSSGLNIISGSSVVINFESTIELVEHTIVAKILPGEFNISLLNPSVRNGGVSSGSVSTDTTALELMVSGTLAPYITTIGFYNDNNELLAIGKLSTPTKRTFQSTQTIVSKFDT